MSLKRDLKEILARVKEAGWTVDVTGGGHLRLAPPASEYRGLRNLRAMLRRRGLAL